MKDKFVDWFGLNFSETVYVRLEGNALAIYSKDLVL